MRSRPLAFVTVALVAYVLGVFTPGAHFEAVPHARPRGSTSLADPEGDVKAAAKRIFRLPDGRIEERDPPTRSIPSLDIISARVDSDGRTLTVTVNTAGAIPEQEQLGEENFPKGWSMGVIFSRQPATEDGGPHEVGYPSEGDVFLSVHAELTDDGWSVGARDPKPLALANETYWDAYCRGRNECQMSGEVAPEPLGVQPRVSSSGSRVRLSVDLARLDDLYYSAQLRIRVGGAIEEDEPDANRQKETHYVDGVPDEGTTLFPRSPRCPPEDTLRSCIDETLPRD